MVFSVLDVILSIFIYKIYCYDIKNCMRIYCLCMCMLSIETYW